jgi:hypothetical protein
MKILVTSEKPGSELGDGAKARSITDIKWDSRSPQISL